MPPVYKLPFWAVTALVCFFGFVMIPILMLLEKSPLTTGRWLLFNPGASVVIPVFAGSATLVFQRKQPSGKFTSVWFHVFLLTAGFAISYWMQHSGVESGFISERLNDLPSERYNTFVRGIGIWFLVHSVIALMFSEKKPRLAFAVCVLCIFAYAGLYYVDRTSWRSDPNNPMDIGNR